MRKNYRKHTSPRRNTSRNRSNRRAFARTSSRRAGRKHRSAARGLNRTRSNKAFNNKVKPFTSPFAKAFIAGCRKGQPCSTVINNICKRTGKSFSTICVSLCKAGVCRGQKFNGQWICWPNFKTPTNTAWARTAQWNLWQAFADWCLASGNCTPANFNKFSATGIQAIFMKHCQPLMTRQCVLSRTSKGKAKSTLKTTAKSWDAWQSKPLAWTRSFAFPTFKSLSRRYARAA
jgi:hypothetical protein